MTFVDGAGGQKCHNGAKR